MRKAILTSVSLLLIALTLRVSAQRFASYSEISVVLKSDSTTKSVLMSDMLENKPGNLSPIIGSATWMDNGRKLQCRSLLSFDYAPVSKFLNAELIIKAELVMIPLQYEDQTEKNEEDLRLTVRRVLEPWEDSTTSWANQPASATNDEVTTRVSRQKKDQPVKINVTQMVKNMIRYKNNGFMICYTDTTKTAKSASDWFASAKHENENARPMLLITYALQYNRIYDQVIPYAPKTTWRQDEIPGIYVPPPPVTPVQVVPPPKGGSGNQNKSDTGTQ